jgi:uncharacterized protein
MKPPILGHLTAPAKLIFVFLLMIACYILLSLAGALVAIPLFHHNLFDHFIGILDFNNPGIVPLLKFLQVIQSVSLFLLPAVLAGILFGGDAGIYLGIRELSTVRIYLGAFLILFVSLPLISWLTSVNEMMKMPGFLAGLEEWMKESEQNAAKLTEIFLRVDNCRDLAVNLFMIAIIPAISEELFFRGLLQRLLSEWSRNIHAGILITSILFAAIHMQFYGFIPRMLLGMIFGYLFVWTGSIWVPVFAHFLNNASAVIVSFLISRGTIAPQYEDFGSTDNLFLVSGSVLLTLGLLYLVFRSRRQERFN